MTQYYQKKFTFVRINDSQQLNINHLGYSYLNAYTKNDLTNYKYISNSNKMENKLYSIVFQQTIFIPTVYYFDNL